MTKVTTIHAHGPDPKYVRTIIPVIVANAIDIGVGDVVKWSVLDDNTAVISVVRDN